MGYSSLKCRCIDEVIDSFAFFHRKNSKEQNHVCNDDTMKNFCRYYIKVLIDPFRGWGFMSPAAENELSFVASHSCTVVTLLSIAS